MGDYMNMNLFEFVGMESDPVYQAVATLQVGETVSIESIQISRFKFYEIESTIEHVPFSDMLSCYRYLSDRLVRGYQDASHD